MDQTATKKRLLQLLARREYSRCELQLKLQQWDVANADAETILTEFVQNSWQSDARFAASICKHRYDQGYGPAKIRAELQQHNLSEAIIDAAFAQDFDWYAQAEKVYQKRYGNVAPASAVEKSKRLKYLLGRGFEFEHFKEFIE